MGRMPCAVCLALAACCMVACDKNKPGVDIPSSGALSTWRWRAVGMKVSPLTTPFPAEGEHPAHLDVRIAFYDTEADETKALGNLTMDVLSAGMKIARVEVSLTDERRHHEHWDPVTETYTVDVQLTGASEPRSGQTLEVRAVFEGEDGSLLHAKREVRWPSTPEPAQP